MMSTRRLIATLVSGAFLALGLAQAANAETVLRFSNWVPNTTHPSPGFEAWGKSIEEASDGRIKVEFFHSGQLGNPRDHYNMARDGIADVAWSVPAFEPDRFPIFEITSLPFLTKDAVTASRVVHDWYNQYAADEMSEVKLCAITMAPEGTLNFKDKEIRTPDQMQGVKIRPVGTFLTQFMKDLGAVPVSIPASEARQAFDRGLVEGIAFPWRTLYPFGLDKATTHHQDMIIYAVAATIVMNKDSYAALSDEDKAVIDAHCTPEWSQRINQMWFDWEKEGRDLLTKDGHTIYQLTDAEQQQWLDAAEPLKSGWVTLVEGRVDNPQQALDSLFSAMSEAGVGY
ncbi:TRAP transporter substrate-binding protein [Hoeflea sp.]|uniref:TRAP transporter substrate-binding protein n=1 Tax=Hoeflea sp. TaxID=1940281 RepID=UPI003B02872C